MTAHSAALVRKNEYAWQGMMVRAGFSLVFALLMAVSANTFFYLPFTPVPVTLQVLTVIFSAIMLGGRWALVSQAAYIALGLAGLPVFAGFISGPAALLGPTGGYILGFAPAAYIAGSLARGRYFSTFVRKNRFISVFIAGMSGLLVIYLLGALHLWGFLSGILPGQGLKEIIVLTWIMGVRPFIIMDMAKILAAMIILAPGIKAYEDYKNK